MEDSAVRYALGQNRLICAQLNYQAISTHLITNAALTKDEDEQIRLKSEDGVGRMNELISLLSMLNSARKFNAFIEAVRASRELDLAKVLLHDHNLHATRIKTNMTPASLFVPVILRNIFEHLSGADLRNARRVCTIWDETITEFLPYKFTLKIRDQRQMIEFMKTAPTSKFCKNLGKFAFSSQNVDPSAGWVFYKAFFAAFGSKISSLELSAALNVALYRLILHPGTRNYLANLTRLKMEAFHSFNHSFIVPADETSPFLPNLKTLDLVEPEDPNDFGFDRLLRFLDMFLQRNPRLTKFFLTCSNDRMSSTFTPGFMRPYIRRIFKSGTIEEIRILGVRKVFLDNDCLRSMTTPTGVKSVLRTARFSLGEISPQIFHDFLDSNRHTLESWSLYFTKGSTAFQAMQGIPSLDHVEQLMLTVDMSDRYDGWSKFSCVSFVKKLIGLKNLKICGFCHQMSPMTDQALQFQHIGLRTLEIDFTGSAVGNGNWLLAFITYIPSSFPNLTLFELLVKIASVNWVWPSTLGRLPLQPQDTDGFSQDKVRYGLPDAATISVLTE